MKRIVRLAALAIPLLVPAIASAQVTEGSHYDGHVNDDSHATISIAIVEDDSSPSGLGANVTFSGLKTHCDDGTNPRIGFTDHVAVDSDGQFHGEGVASAKSSVTGDLNSSKGTGTVKYKTLPGTSPTCNTGVQPWKVKLSPM